MTGLRFAPVVRVSTERQEKKGESLATQRKQLEAAIKSLNGTVYKWYAGQEHATPDHERKILNELMVDAQAGMFDAVMVADISRWSRDNQKSKKYLRILKAKQIQFYWLGRHMDLNLPFNNLMIGMGTEINEFVAAEQSYKSYINKIELAKKGYPSSGQIPYGRKFNKKIMKWDIDEEKRRIITDAANRYLNGESLQTIAAFYNMNLPNLHKLLKERSGDTWNVCFKSKDFGIDETVIIKVPRLLPQNVIDEIKKRSESNKTYTHGQSKNKYLLSRMIFCDECGYALPGTPSHNRKLYYKHSRNCGCKNFNSIPTDIIESAVIEDIFKMLGDLPRIEQATKAAIPDLKEMDELRREIEQSQKELLKTNKMKDKLLDLAENGTLSDDEIKERIDKHRATEAYLKSKIELGKSKLINIPSDDDIKRKSGRLLSIMRNILKRKKHLDAEMTFDDKRKLLEYAFGGKDADGKRCGVYIRKLDNGRWFYTINGLFYDSKGTTRKIDISGQAPKIYDDEYVYEPLEDSWPIIASAEEADALTAEAGASYMQSAKQDMLGINKAKTCFDFFFTNSFLDSQCNIYHLNTGIGLKRYFFHGLPFVD
jgi:DNA invertase Pin-like site-specific DNA recombinase